MKASPKPLSVALAPSEAAYNRVRFADSLDDDDEGDGAEEAEQRARAAATRDRPPPARLVKWSHTPGARVYDDLFAAYKVRARARRALSLSLALLLRNPLAKNTTEASYYE